MPKFEDCLQRLEQIVDELERGNVPLEQALKLFEEGLKHSSSCRKELEEAEGKVEILLRQNGKLQPEPYEPAERAPDRQEIVPLKPAEVQQRESPSENNRRVFAQPMRMPFMKPLSVVVAQSNSKTAEMLEKSLYNHFRVVHLAGDVDACV